MCDPVTIAGAVLSGASVAANSAAQSKVASARRDAMSAERIRQQGYQRETDALNVGAQDRYQKFGDQQTEKAKSLGDFFNAQNQSGQPQAANGAPQELAPTSASNIVVAEQAKQGARAKAYSDQQGNALGGLRSFGDLLGGIGLKQARDAGYIGQIGGFEKGSSNALGYELESANSAGNGMKLFGDLLAAGGSLATGYGLSRNVAGAATAGSNVLNQGKEAATRVAGNGFQPFLTYR
jgi:hypothetical protein